MSYDLSTIDFNRVCMAASFAAIALFGGPIDVEANVPPVILEESPRFQIFENNQPTSQTHIVKQYVLSDLTDSFSVEHSWINAELASFVNDLNAMHVPEYSEDLLSLADEILKNNPEALKGLL